MIAIEPVIAPAASFSAISSELEAIESAAAPDLVLITAAPDRRTGMPPAPARRARGD